MGWFPKEGRLNELNAVAGVGGVNLSVHLFVNNITPDDDTGLMTLLEAAWDTYFPYSSSLWGIPFIDTNGDAVIRSPVIVWRGPNVVPGATVYGFFVCFNSVAGPVLWMVERLVTPTPVAFPTDQVPIRVEVRLRFPALPP